LQFFFVSISHYDTIILRTLFISATDWTQFLSLLRISCPFSILIYTYYPLHSIGSFRTHAPVCVCVWCVHTGHIKAIYVCTWEVYAFGRAVGGRGNRGWGSACGRR